MQKKKNNKNYAVIIYENGYPNVGGSATLIGVYPSNRAAAFISKTVKERNKLPFFPIIEPTDNPPTTTLVEGFLERMDEIKEEIAKAKLQQDKFAERSNKPSK